MNDGIPSGHFPVFLGDVHPLGGIWLVCLILEHTYQLLNMGYTEAVNGFSIDTFCHVALLRINTLVGNVVHLFIKQ